MLKEICQLQLADLAYNDSLNHESIQIRISRHTIAKPANHELNHQNWQFVQALLRNSNNFILFLLIWLVRVP